METFGAKLGQVDKLEMTIKEREQALTAVKNPWILNGADFNTHPAKLRKQD